MIEFLVMLIIFAIVVYAVYVVLGMLPIPDPIRTLVYLLVALIFLVMLLDKAGIYHMNLS